MVAKEVRMFGITPRIAMLSYSNFGTSNTPEAILVRRAREIVKEKNPGLIVDGEMQGIVAFNKEILSDNYPFSELVHGDVNTLIFPNLSAGNIAYNLLQEVGILMPSARPIGIEKTSTYLTVGKLGQKYYQYGAHLPCWMPSTKRVPIPRRP